MQALFQYFIFELTAINIALILVAIVCIYNSHRNQLREYAETGYIFDTYQYEKLIFFAPVFEEVIFRGIILSFLMHITDSLTAIGVSSLLFGVWHVKNITWQSKGTTIRQILYAGLVIGPILAICTLYTGNILLAISVHAANNYIAPLFNKKFGFTA